MKWRIKNPAPLDSRLKKWGDYHFSRSLAKYLVRLGEEVETDYQPQWQSAERCDVVLVLRGKYPFEPEQRHPGALHVMWNMSHPEALELDEYASYDLVLVASRQRAATLRQRLDVPVHEFLQCTDTEEFFLDRGLDHDGRHDIVFVGNTRDERRDAVLWAVEAGFPVKIWGRGWEKWVPACHVVADYVDNQMLGDLYGRSRLTLNDHWPDMREHGFVNNRVFDALACGLPILSDRHPALVELFPDEVLYYSNREEMLDGLEQSLLSYPRVADAARSAASRVAREFSFERRAEELLDLVLERLGRPPRQRTGAASMPEAHGWSPPEPEADVRWCPVCEQYSDAFLPFGQVQREEARCAVCGALERHRSAWLFLRLHTNLCDGLEKRLLHCSPEKHLGRIFQRMPELHHIGSDLFPPDISVGADLTRLPFAADSLDAVYCSHVLEHIEDDAAAMSELFRVLRPGGWSLVMTPIQGETTYEDFGIRSEEERLKHFGQRDHVRIYGRDLGQRLASAGFEVQERRGHLDLSEEYQRFMGLKAVFLYYCRKPGLRASATA